MSEDPLEIKSYLVSFEDDGTVYAGSLEERLATANEQLQRRIPWFTQLITQRGIKDISFKPEDIGTNYAFVECNSITAQALEKLPGITDVCPMCC